MDGLAGTALPEPAARFDRALVYGGEWQLGHDKLPPLPWWLVEVVDQLAGRDFVYYLLAELAVIAAFALVFAAARRLVGTLGALVAVLIIDGLHYYNYTAAKFNHDVIQLPFWALAGFAFHRALRGRHWGNWLLLGLALGLSLWAKYFVVVLAVPLALFLPYRPQCAREPGDARRGAVVVWTDGDVNRLPQKFAAVAEGAIMQTPFTLPNRRGPGSASVSWAILPPRP